MKKLIAGLVVSACLAAPAFAQTDTVTIASGDKTHTIRVDVADTLPAATAGLAGRTALPAGQGLLVDYRKAGDFVSPTMKGVAFDLDFLFVAPDGTIIATVQHARAGSLRPLWAGLGLVAAVEIPAGQVAALGIKTGDKVRHRIFGNAG
jgi:uncharacterized membrane protein (UPF0127 family)